MTTTSDTLQALILVALKVPKTAIITPAPGNVGNGIVRDVLTTAPVLIGNYTVGLADAENYTVTAPGGAVIGAGAVPTNGRAGGFNAAGMEFAIKAGTVPFQAGDHFTLTTVWPTIAGSNIFAPRDWPSTKDKYPMLKLSSPKELKTSLGPNAPQFDVVTTIRITGSITATPVKQDLGAGVAQELLGVLQRQIEVAVINDYDLFRTIQEMESVDIINQVTDRGTDHLGELTMDFAMKFPQGPEDFAPILASTIDQVRVIADLVNLADPTGIYTPEFDYPVTPEPRTEGPDGRAEGDLLLPVND